jgi:hypothetical protein
MFGQKIMQTKTIAMILLIAIATIGAIGIAVEAGTQSAQAMGRVGGNDNNQGNDNSGVNDNTGGNSQGS